jgi:enoyl-CoA hydratase
VYLFPVLKSQTLPSSMIFMPYTNLLFDVADGIAQITINRPDKLNALNDAVIAELGEATGAVERDRTIRAVILTGSGPKAFVAGADIGELAQQGPFDGKARALVGQGVFRRIERLGKPVIAAVNGFALGGGCELAMACHIRIAAENARFGQPEAKLGIAPGYGGSVRLPRLVGKGRALEILLTGQMIDAAEAYRIGLVNRVVPADQLIAEARKLAGTIIENGPLAIQVCIEAVDSALETTLDEGLLLEANYFGLLAGTADMREGMAAFLEKRKANFSGK